MLVHKATITKNQHENQEDKLDQKDLSQHENHLNQHENHLNQHENHAYNWTEVERHDSSDLLVQLRSLSPDTFYHVLVQAVNDFGVGPAEAVDAQTQADGQEFTKIKS